MSFIDVRLVGDKKVVARFRSLGGRLMSELNTSIRQLTMRLLQHVQRDKLQGQVLRHVTGKLSRSMEQKVIEEPNSIVGRVFSNGTAPYAAAHEFGFHGSEAVRAHQRTITQAFGRALAEPVVVQVAPFERQMNMPERSFLRSGLTDMAAQIESGIQEAVIRAAQLDGA